MQLKYRKWEGRMPPDRPTERVMGYSGYTSPDTSGQLETLVFRGISSVYSDIPKIIMSECNVESTDDGLLKWQSFSMNHHFKTSPFGWPCVYSVAKQQAAWALEWACLVFGESEKDRKRNGRNFLMELIIWQNYLNLNCVNLNYWQVSFNKTEYYV